MFYIGQNVRSQETLTPISEEALYDIIKDDTHKLANFVERLRKLLTIDKAAYTNQKARLPYFCMSSFEANVRHGDNFLETKYLVLDFDNLPFGQIELAQSALSQNPRTRLLYRTPSNVGLKVVVALHQPLKDKKIYHDLGKTFGTALANQYNLIPYLDAQTFDITRASFICPDFLAWYNPKSTPVNWQEYTRHSLLMSKYADDEIIEKKAVLGEPDNEIYKIILNKLKPNASKPSGPAVLNEHLQAICSALEKKCPEFDLALTNTKAIQYGAQLRITHTNGQMGECNLYFGKKGFSIVKAMKANLKPELNDILEKLLWQCINNLNNKVTIEHTPKILRKA